MNNIRYWIFRIPDWRKMLNGKDNFTFKFDYKRRFSGTINDKVVILDKKTSGFYFSSSFTIKDVKIEQTPSENGGFTNNHTIVFELVDEFKENKPIEYYLYSIKRVRNWESPNNHFKLKYSEVNQLEFEAIIEDKVFLERTILGGVINELPVEHRQSFMELLMAEMPSVFFEIKDYTKVFELLKQYLEFAIINPSKMLYESFSLIKEILPDQNLDDVSFGEVNMDFQVSSQARIKDQVDLIGLNLSGFIELLEMGTKTKTQEDKLFKSFNDLFKGTNLSHLIKSS